MISFQGTWVLARKEIAEHFQSKRFYIIGGLFALSVILATILGKRLYDSFLPDEFADDANAVPTLLSLYLSTFQGILLLKLLALVLAADAVVSEWKDRTLFILLSKPISRTAMLTGKILAAYLTVLLVFVAGFAVGLVVLLVDVGMPGAEAWGRILGGLGILAAGLLPFVALATMFSAVFKSTATSYAISIILVMLVLPLLFTIIAFFVIIGGGFEDALDSPVLQIMQLIDPSVFLQAATYIMVGTSASSGGIPIQQPDVAQFVGSAFLAMAVHLAVYLGVSYWIVNRRDYA